MRRFEIPLVQGRYYSYEEQLYGVKTDEPIVKPYKYALFTKSLKQIAPSYEENEYDIKEKQVLDGYAVFHNQRYTAVSSPLLVLDDFALMVEIDVYINGDNEPIAAFSVILDTDKSFHSLRIADIAVTDEVVLLAYYRDGFVKVGTGIEFGIYNMERDKYYPKVCSIKNAKNYSDFRFIDEQHFTLKHWDKGIKGLGPVYDSGYTFEQYSFEIKSGKRVKVRRMSSEYYPHDEQSCALAWKKTPTPDSVGVYDSKRKFIQVYNKRDNSVVEELLLEKYSIVGIFNTSELNLAMLYVKDIDSELYDLWIFQRDIEWQILDKYEGLQAYDFNYDYEAGVLVIRTINNTVVYMR